MKPAKTHTTETFGTYLRDLLRQKGRKARELAFLLKFKPPYISDVLAGNNKPLKFLDLQKIESWLPLSPNEADLLYDLAGQGRNEIAPDLTVLIQGNKQVHDLLRVIKRSKVTNKQLQQFCEILKQQGQE